MSVPSELSAAESRQTLLLYCPYDHKVTRHARRGSAHELVCLECGRKLDAAPRAEAGVQAHAAYVQRTAPMGAVGDSVRSARVGVRRPPAWHGFGRRLLLVGLALVVGMAAINVVVRVVASPQSSEDVAAGASVAATSDGLLIAKTDGVGAFVRRTPNLEDRLRAWPDGTRLTVTGPDITADGVEWKQVQDPAGNRGWIPAQYTSPEPRSGR